MIDAPLSWRVRQDLNLLSHRREDLRIPAGKWTSFHTPLHRLPNARRSTSIGLFTGRETRLLPGHKLVPDQTRTTLTGPTSLAPIPSSQSQPISTRFVEISQALNGYWIWVDHPPHDHSEQNPAWFGKEQKYETSDTQCRPCSK